MTSELHADIQGSLSSIAELPEPRLRFLASVGFFRCFPSWDDPEVSGFKSCPEIEHAVVDEGLLINMLSTDPEIDPDDPLPRLEFLQVLDRVAQLSNSQDRKDKLTAIARCALADAQWVGW